MKPFKNRDEMAAYLFGSIADHLKSGELRYQLRLKMREVDEAEGLMVEFDRPERQYV